MIHFGKLQKWPSLQTNQTLVLTYGPFSVFSLNKRFICLNAAH